MEQITFQITNVLGEARVVNGCFESGHYNCPWCCYPVFAGETCPNPSCFAGKWASVERATKAKAQHEARLKEENERKRNHELAMIRIREENHARHEARAAFVAKVRAAKGCLRCSDQYHDKVRKHRLECPKAR